MNTNQDLVKLQRLQNRPLRMCFDVRNPVDISIKDLHINARVSLLNERRDLNLLCIMYDLKQLHLYERISDCETRQGDKYIFQTYKALMGIYMRVPLTM